MITGISTKQKDSREKLTKDIFEERLENWRLFYKAIANIPPEKITDQTKYYIDYYYDLVWKYVTMLTDRNKRDLRFIKKHTRFIFLLMRKYRISIGDSFFERFGNYFRLLFPKINKNTFETRRDYHNAKRNGF